ncbi:MAG: SPOR domain-containing protein [Acidobacteria bacterium]|nr:SPOR domain-containing protein [Acidobacteriota bacterium]
MEFTDQPFAPGPATLRDFEPRRAARRSQRPWTRGPRLALVFLAALSLGPGRAAAQGTVPPPPPPPAAAPSTVAPERPLTADEALWRLTKGYERYRSGRFSERNYDRRREELRQAQRPYAAVLTCSDSRVPPELIFDEDLGRLYVVRVAAGVIDPVTMGSLEDAVGRMGVPVILFMGHTGCGLVRDACTGEAHVGGVGDIVARIQPACTWARREAGDEASFIRRATQLNVFLQMSRCLKNSTLIAERVKTGRLRLLGAVYEIDTGELRMMGDVAIGEGLKLFMDVGLSPITVPAPAAAPAKAPAAAAATAPTAAPAKAPAAAAATAPTAAPAKAPAAAATAPAVVPPTPDPARPAASRPPAPEAPHPAEPAPLPAGTTRPAPEKVSVESLESTGGYNVAAERKARPNIFTDGKQYCVQVSAFRKREVAEGEAARLRAKKLAAFVVAGTADGTWYRVRVAGFGTLAEAVAFEKSRKR